MVGARATITAQIVDDSGFASAVGGRTVTWSRTGGSGGFSAATSVTNAAGVATVTFTADTVVGGTTITVTDANGLTGSVNQPMDPGTPAKLAFATPPSNTGWLTVMNPSVRVLLQDRYSNTVTSSTTQVALSLVANPGAATLSGGGATSPTNGIVTFNALLLDKAGTGYTLQAAATSGGITPVTSAPFAVSAISTLATASTSLIGLAVVGSSIYISADSNQGSFANFAKISTTGGPFTVGALTNGFDNPSGRVITSGGLVYMLGLTGGLVNKSTSFVSITPSNDAVTYTSIHSTSGFFQGTGPDLNFDGTYFYVPYYPVIGDTNMGIARVRASDGASIRLLAQSASSISAAYAANYRIAVAGGQVYYVDGTTIQRMSVDSGPSTTVTTGVGSPGALASALTSGWGTMLIVGPNIYWSENGVIRSAPITGGAATTLVTGLTSTARSMVSDGNYLYVNDGGSLRRISLSDFSVTTLAANDGVGDIALDAQAVYWTSSVGGVRTVKKTAK